jgi:hypothetical protein
MSICCLRLSLNSIILNLHPFADQASIITGLVIAVISVTWAAYSAAGSIYHSVASDSSGRSGSNGSSSYIPFATPFSHFCSAAEAARAELNAVIVGGDATSKARAGEDTARYFLAVVLTAICLQASQRRRTTLP